MKKRTFSFFFLLALLLAGCDSALPDRAASDASVWAMDTQMDLRLYGDTDGTVMADLIAILNELDHKLSATSADSVLTALNESGRSDDEEIEFLAEQALKLWSQTDGALDITLLPVSRAWGFSTGSYRVVPAAELEALRAQVGMDKLEVSDSTAPSRAELLLSDGAMLDFGALAKGWAAERCKARMEQAKLSGILSLGGNIQTVGTKPDGSDWVVGVQDPDDPGRYVLTLRLTGSKAAVASGDYQRYFMQDGVRYCHILDPKTLSPVQGSLRSVTVVTDSGLRADGLSTALYVLGREAGTELWRKLGDFEAIWIEADGSVWITPGLQDRVAEGAYQVIEA